MITGLVIYTLYFVEGTVPDREAAKPALLAVAVPGFLSFAFLTVGGLMLKSSRKVTDKDLVASGGMKSRTTYPDGSAKVTNSSALPLFKWVGRILFTAGLAMIAGGLYVLIFSSFAGKMGMVAYLFGVGTYLGLLGWFFIWYRRRILRAQKAMAERRDG
jgi:hypothetical protein